MEDEELQKAIALSLGSYDEETTIALSGPSSYYRIPITDKEGKLLKVIHFFGDYHINKDRCDTSGPVMTTQQLVDQTLAHYKYSEPEHKIDIMFELGLSAPVSTGFLVPRRPIDAFNYHYQSKGCFQRPHSTRMCEETYSNARFHNTDYRYTILNELINTLAYYDVQEDKELADQCNADPGRLTNQQWIKISSDLLKLLDVKKRITVMNSFLFKQQKLIVTDDVFKQRSNKNKLSKLRLQIEFYEWVSLMMDYLVVDIMKLLDDIDLDEIISNLSSGRRISLIDREKIQRTYYFYSKLFIDGQKGKIWSKYIMLSLLNNPYIYNRLLHDIKNTTPIVKEKLEATFNSLWTTRIGNLRKYEEKIKNNVVDKEIQEVIMNIRVMLMDFYTVARLFKVFKSGEEIKHCIMYFGESHIKNIIKLIALIDTINTEPTREYMKTIYKNLLEKEEPLKTKTVTDDDLFTNVSQCNILKLRYDSYKRFYLPYENGIYSANPAKFRLEPAGILDVIRIRAQEDYKSNKKVETEKLKKFYNEEHEKPIQIRYGTKTIEIISYIGDTVATIKTKLLDRYGIVGEKGTLIDKNGHVLDDKDFIWGNYFTFESGLTSKMKSLKSKSKKSLKSKSKKSLKTKSKKSLKTKSKKSLKTKSKLFFL